LVAEARAVNKKMPKHAVRELDRALGSLVGQTVVVLGASYRGGVKETAFSGVWDLVREITDFGGLPVVFDPMFSDDELRSIQLEPYVLGRYAAGAIVQADHPEFEELCKAFIPGLRAIYDGRRILDPTKFEGVELLKIGSGIVG
jgi:UDP-N-acetyl-D-mannosaminuronate dehydrogenase